jgi:hypothetical protein
MAKAWLSGSANIRVEGDGSEPRLRRFQDNTPSTSDMEWALSIGDVKVWASSPEVLAAWFASMSGWLLDQSDSERAA